MAGWKRHGRRIFERLLGRRTVGGDSLGERGERLAAQYLLRQGMTLVGRRVRIGGGELDLIAVDGRTIVFVEVKTRGSDVAGHPLEAISDDKRRRLTRAALAYLRRHDLLEYAARFDVIAVIWPETGEGGGAAEPQIVHVRSAFEPLAGRQMFA